MSWTFGAAIALIAIGIAGSGIAGEIAGSGFIEDVSLDDGTVQIKHKLFRVTRRSEIFDGAGELVTLRQLSKIQPGPWVQYTAKDYAGDAEITMISIVPDD